jgi:methylenetetrahydrofolate dehydrogenase (NADP+) / methenyltetrahydrofolate cyclohydrolase
MTARILDGKALSESIRHELRDKVATFRQRHGRVPGLHVVLCGDDSASSVYVRNKEKAALEVGMAGMIHRFPTDVSEATLLGLVDELNHSAEVDGILVQLPLPRGLRSQLVLERISPEKDVDGFHPSNVGALWSGLPGLVPCTPRGCLRLLDEAKIELGGARALVVGRSNIVGKPVAALLLARHATVTVAHSRTDQLAERCREADVLVAAIGRAKMIPGSWLKSGAVVIDVGMNRDENGRLCGDVDTASALGIASAITPVPGGVGPMTIAMLLDNTLLAAEARARGAS